MRTLSLVAFLCVAALVFDAVAFDGRNRQQLLSQLQQLGLKLKYQIDYQLNRRM